MALAIECKHLDKSYGKFKALDDINLSLEQNKIIGLLGRNGAGKTTLLNLLASHTLPTQGELKIFGQGLYENTSLLESICLIKEKDHFYKNMTMGEIIKVAAAFYPHWDGEYARKLVQVFELDLKKAYKKVSKGMESALGIVIGLASRAPLTLFDEPSLGLDAVARQRFYDMVLADYLEHPRTLVISTHMIDEVSKLFEEVVVIDKGKIKLVEEAEALRQQYVYVSGPKEAVKELMQGKEVLHTEEFGSILVAAMRNTLTRPEQEKAEKAGMNLEAIPLQKLFVYLTGMSEEGNHEN